METRASPQSLAWKREANMAEAAGGLGLRQLEGLQFGDRPAHAHRAVAKLRRQFGRRGLGRDAVHQGRQEDQLRRRRETIRRSVALAAKMLPQIHRQLRREQLIAGHDEGDVLGNEAMAVVVAQPLGHEDHRASGRLATHEIAMLRDRGRGIVLNVDRQHQDAGPLENFAFDQDIALGQERWQLGA